MAFVLQRIEGAKVVLVEVRERSLRIGRGANAHLRSENASLALDHAVIEEDAAGYVLSDRGSTTGSYLNGRPVESARLAKGDVIEVGDLRLSVEVATQGRPLFLGVRSLVEDRGRKFVAAEEVEAPAVQVSRGKTIAARAFDYDRAYSIRRSRPSLGLVTLVALVAGIVFVAWTVKRGHQSLFMPGTLSVAHSRATSVNGVPLMLKEKCSACHTPFAGASNSKCQNCHQQTFHQVKLAALGSCVKCHPEHRSVPRLAEVQQGVCIDCHEDLRRRFPQSSLRSRVTGFGVDHPEILLTAAHDDRPVSGVHDGTDLNTLKFNHRCHLAGECRKQIAGVANQFEPAPSCSSCHVVDVATGSMRPLSYDASCARCHPLTFDNRFPPVPHGLSPGAVAGVIATAYAGNGALLTAPPDEIARVFSRREPVQDNVQSAVVRNAQRTIRVRCTQCHAMQKDGLTVIPPITHRQWLPAIRRFSHTVHLQSGRSQCTDCHTQTISSRSTADISLPGVKQCAVCHGVRADESAGTLSRCTTCHFYHDLTSKLGQGWSRTMLSAADDSRRDQASHMK